MRRALPRVTPGAAGSLQPVAWHWSTNGRDGSGRTFSIAGRWLVVDNVAISVATLPTPSAADRVYIDRLVAALRG